MSSSSQRPVPDEPASLYGPYPKPSAERAQDVAQRIEAVRKRITDAAEKAKKAGGSGKVVSLRGE